MSQENVESFERAVEAINRGDVEAVLEELDPAVEFHAVLEELLGGEGRVYRGHAGYRDFIRDFGDAFAEVHWEFSDIRDLGDRLLAIGSFRARGDSGASAEEASRRGGRLRERSYDTRAVHPRSGGSPRSRRGCREAMSAGECSINSMKMIQAFRPPDVPGVLRLMDPEIEFEHRLETSTGAPLAAGCGGVRRRCPEYFDASRLVP